MEPLSQPGPLTEMDRFVFECFGYLIIPDVLTSAECDEAREAAVRVHSGHEQGQFRQVGRGFEREPALERLIDHPAVLPKVRGLLGDRFVLQAAWCTVMPAGSRHTGWWHQDGSSSYEFKQLGYPVPLIQLRASYALSDQSRDNMGNMMLIPGSHRCPVSIPQATREDIAACPIRHVLRVTQGSVLLFHNGVYHCPMPNEMEYDRYNMHYIYSPPWLRRSDRDATDPEFLERTTPLRRALMGDFERPEIPFAGGFPPIPFEDQG